MAAAKSTQSGLPVPGISASSAVPRGSAFALFVPGFETYSAITAGTVKIRGASGDDIEAKIVGAEVGRLFNLASRFMAQAPLSNNTPMLYNGGSFQDVMFFNGLVEAYGKDKVGPIEPYTVLLLAVDSVMAAGAPVA